MAQQMDPSYYANLPAGTPPPGVTPNLDNPESRAIQAHIGMGVCMGVTLVLVVLRMYVKLAINHLCGWEDCESFERNGHLYMLTAVGACLLGFVRNSLICPISVALMVVLIGTYRRA